jgi:hypothetical protein
MCSAAIGALKLAMLQENILHAAGLRYPEIGLHHCVVESIIQGKVPAYSANARQWLRIIG